MKTTIRRLAAAALLGGFLAPSCAPYYPPGAYAGQSDSKGGSVPMGPAPAYGPPRLVVDPALAVAGLAAAGVLGYAIGNHHSHGHSYCGPVYYGHGYHGCH